MSQQPGQGWGGASEQDWGSAPGRGSAGAAGQGSARVAGPPWGDEADRGQYRPAPDQPSYGGGQSSYGAGQPSYGAGQSSGQPSYGAGPAGPAGQAAGQPGASADRGVPGVPGAPGASGGQPGSQASAARTSFATQQLPTAEPKGFVSALFDFSFTSFVTPKVVKVLYVLIVVIVGLSALGFALSMLATNVGLGLIVLLVGAPLYFLVVIALYRILLEFFMVVFRMAQDIRAIRERGDLQ